MKSNKDADYVQPETEPGDQGTEPWAEGEAPDASGQEEASPADHFTRGNSAGVDFGSADDGGQTPPE